MSFDITSPNNPRIKRLLRLRERRQRDAAGVFTIEGRRLYDRAISAGLEPEATFVSESGFETIGPTFTVAPSVLDRVSYRRKSEGIIAVFKQLDFPLSSLEVGPNPLLLIAEGIEKPGNLGAMARTVASAGADALIAIGRSVDPYNPNSLRASTGALFEISLAVTDWGELAAWLEEWDVVLLGATPEATNTLWATDLTRSVAVLVGAEDSGLSEEARHHTTELIAIPTAAGITDSLNASVAAAVLLYEAVRQRGG